MTSAIPSPNATTRTSPKAGRPAAIEPSRIRSALVEGIRPPARPRTNRLRQVIVVPAGGQVGVGDAAVAVGAGVAGRPSSCPRSSAWSCPWSWASSWSWRAGGPLRPPAPAGDDDPRRPASSRRSPGSRSPPRPAPTARRHRATARPRRRSTSAARTQDPERVRQRHRQPEADGMDGRPARPDQVGGHQGLAVAGRQRVAGPEARPRSAARGAARAA